MRGGRAPVVLLPRWSSGRFRALVGAFSSLIVFSLTNFGFLFFFVFCSFARGRVLPLSPVPVQRPLEAIYKTIFVSSVFVASFFKVLKSARLNHILCSEGFCLECKYVTDSRPSLMHLNLRQMHSQRKRKTSCLEP